MAVRIRKFEEGDYEGMVALHNAVYPNYPESAADWRRQDGLKEAKIRWGRFVVEAGNRIIAGSAYDQFSWSYHPRKFWVNVMVHPDHRGQGLGAALYEQLMVVVAELDPLLVRSEVNEEAQVDRRFAAARGFAEIIRDQESVLQFAAFDPERFAPDVARVTEQDIAIFSYAELKESDPDNEARWYDMDVEIAADVPDPDDFTPQTFEVWRKKKLENPRFLPACNMIAVDGDRYVGLSNLWDDEMAGRLMTGLTGVRRAYRQRGIATALKVRALTAAKAAGHEQTITWNDSNNQGMLGINRRLGFEFQPAWLRVEKVLDGSAPAQEQADQSRE